jgi:hypothetical protein
MDIDDKELFSSAMADEPISDVADPPAEAPATETPQQDDRPRDEHGRFAPKQPAEPEPAPAAPDQGQAKDEGNVPSWRLREVREEAERRVAETEARWQRQFELMQRQAQPKPEPQAPPDLFENPTGFVDQNVRQYVDPVKAEIQQMREFYSRRDAEKDHGAEKVRAAYDWVAQGIAQRDPDVVMAYNRAMQSQHPFDTIVTAHQARVVHQMIGNDPNAWFDKELERRMGSDPQFAARFQQAASQERAGRQPSNQPQGSITKLPPSLRNTPSARGNGADDDPSDMSDAALFRHAMR